MICPACGHETVFIQCPSCKAQARDQRARLRQAGQAKKTAARKAREAAAKRAAAKRAARIEARRSHLQRLIADARAIIERVEAARAAKDSRRIEGMSGILRKTPPKETPCNCTTKT